MATENKDKDFQLLYELDLLLDHQISLTNLELQTLLAHGAESSPPPPEE